VIQAAVEGLLAQRGGMSRLFHAVYARIRASWQMLPLGFLFDLGFDTATEVAVLGLSVRFEFRQVPTGSQQTRRMAQIDLGTNTL
jgi:high-affinity nickel permease